MGYSPTGAPGPIQWPTDVGRVRYKYSGGRFLPFDQLDSLWQEIADDIVDQGGAFDRRWGAGALYSYVRQSHAMDPTVDHWLFSWPEVEPGRLLYHYTSASTLGIIAQYGTLRMGPLREMRDPREFCEWRPSSLTVAGTSLDVDQLALAVGELRRNTKIVCFGRDPDPTDDAADAVDRILDPYKGRGFLRPRMWEQYADKHAGACLIFDRVAIDRAFAERLSHETEEPGSVLPRPIPFNGEVEYDDSFNRRVHASQLGIVDDNYSLFDWVSEDEWIEEAFLTKDIDWRTEHEYRWGLMTGRPGPLLLELPPGCIVGVVVGLAWDDDNRSALQSFAQRFDIGANVARAAWDPNHHQLGCRLVDVAQDGRPAGSEVVGRP